VQGAMNYNKTNKKMEGVNMETPTIHIPADIPSIELEEIQKLFPEYTITYLVDFLIGGITEKMKICLLQPY
jgi:hypothetical protein